MSWLYTATTSLLVRAARHKDEDSLIKMARTENGCFSEVELWTGKRSGSAFSPCIFKLLDSFHYTRILVKIKKKKKKTERGPCWPRKIWTGKGATLLHEEYDIHRWPGRENRFPSLQQLHTHPGRSGVLQPIAHMRWPTGIPPTVCARLGQKDETGCCLVKYHQSNSLRTCT